MGLHALFDHFDAIRKKLDLTIIQKLIRYQRARESNSFVKYPSRSLDSTGVIIPTWRLQAPLLRPSINSDHILPYLPEPQNTLIRFWAALHIQTPILTHLDENRLLAYPRIRESYGDH